MANFSDCRCKQLQLIEFHVKMIFEIYMPECFWDCVCVLFNKIKWIAASLSSQKIDRNGNAIIIIIMMVYGNREIMQLLACKWSNNLKIWIGYLVSEEREVMKLINHHLFDSYASWCEIRDKFNLNFMLILEDIQH